MRLPIIRVSVAVRVDISPPSLTKVAHEIDFEYIHRTVSPGRLFLDFFKDGGCVNIRFNETALILPGKGKALRTGVNW